LGEPDVLVRYRNPPGIGEQYLSTLQSHL